MKQLVEINVITFMLIYLKFQISVSAVEWVVPLLHGRDRYRPEIGCNVWRFS
jgi:hypothetical protein